MIKEEIDWFLDKCCEATKIPKGVLDRKPTAGGELALERLTKMCERLVNENINNLNDKDMVRKKKLYLVWQTSGSFADSTYRDRLCGVFDNEEMATALKAELDLNVVKEENCWNIVPKDIWESWPTVDCEDSERQFEYVMEYEGYTCIQRDEQENRWVLMTKEYSEAVIEVVNMNESL
jgi:hypothetical protein